MNYQNPFAHLDCEFIIKQSKRASRISIRIKPPKQVILVIPPGSSAKKAYDFAKEHASWVEKKLTIIEHKNKLSNIPITSESDYKTKCHTIVFKRHNKERAHIRILESETQIFIPISADESSKQVQEVVNTALKETYRAEAKLILPKRIQELAIEHGFKYNKVTVRDSKTRWGSCSSQKNISLSLSLMKLPDYLIDYILLHELCHTIEMNHGPKFYHLLDKVTGGRAISLRKEVKQHSIEGN